MAHQTTTITFSQIADLVIEKKDNGSFQDILSYVKTGFKDKVELPIIDERKQENEPDDRSQQFIYTNPEKDLLFIRMKHPNPRDNTSNSTFHIYNLSNEIIPDEQDFNQHFSDNTDPLYIPNEELVDKQVLLVRQSYNNGFDVSIKRISKQTYESCLKYLSHSYNTSSTSGPV